MLENWTPAKGPKPPHLRVRSIYQPTNPNRRDFSFELPRSFRAERRALLEALMEHHDDQKVVERVGSSLSDSGAEQERIEKPFRSGVIRINLNVKALASLSVTQASRLIHGFSPKLDGPVSELVAKPLRVDITYPLTRGVELTVRPFVTIHHANGKTRVGARRMTVGYFLWTVAQEYLRIYEEWRHYRVWGHELDDLYFERMSVGRGKACLLVGS